MMLSSGHQEPAATPGAQVRAANRLVEAVVWLRRVDSLTEVADPRAASLELPAAEPDGQPRRVCRLLGASVEAAPAVNATPAARASARGPEGGLGGVFSGPGPGRCYALSLAVLPGGVQGRSVKPVAELRTSCS